MYSKREHFILGFHGCDESVKKSALASKEHLKHSENEYDWLGHGIYFWENDPTRAFEFVKQQMKRPNSKIKTPSVLGAVLHLGNCLNLLTRNAAGEIAENHDLFLKYMKTQKLDVPVNKNTPASKDFPLRMLDCAVINYLHQIREERKLPAYDSVYAVFEEGAPLYADSGFHEFTHIHICIRNSDCIKGYFDPLIDTAGNRTMQPSYTNKKTRH